jgi:hypothetical protein
MLPKHTTMTTKVWMYIPSCKNLSFQKYTTNTTNVWIGNLLVNFELQRTFVQEKNKGMFGLRPKGERAKG